MENTMLNVTEEEMICIKARATEILASVNPNVLINDRLQEYCMENGYTSEDAYILVEQVVIHQVDQYNESCRRAIQEGGEEWVMGHISERIANMNMAEEAQYKVYMLQAIQAMNQQILLKAGLYGDDEMEKEFEAISKQMPCLPVDSEITPEFLAHVNGELADAIMNSGVALHHSAMFEELVAERLDEESIKTFVIDMWKDERYKYCAGTAACVARHNEELPSVPEETTDAMLVFGICQGIDVEVVENKLSRGEITVERAVALLGIISIVGLTLAGIVLLYHVGATTAFIASKAAFRVCGKGMMGVLVASILTYGMFSYLIDHLPPVINGALNVIEVAYTKTEAGAKAVCRQMEKHVIPAVKASADRVRMFVMEQWHSLCQHFTKRSVDVQMN